MAFSLYDATVANYLQILGSVGGFLDKGLTHLRDKGVDPAEIVERMLVLPIAPAARSPSPSRDFLHWPFAHAGRRCMPRRRHGRHPQTFILADIGQHLIAVVMPVSAPIKALV
jgi:hypothetical protein